MSEEPVVIARPRTCPCCEKGMVGKILCCAICWFTATPADRAEFSRLFKSAPNAPHVWSKVGNRIIRYVRQKLGKSP